MTGCRYFGSVRKLPSGRYQASYWHEGQRHVGPDTFAAKGDAQAWIARAEGDLARGSWIAPGAGKVTLAEVADRWLTANPAKRLSTWTRDASIVKTYIVPVLGSRRIDQITKADVQRVVDGWATKLKPSTVERMAGVVRSIYFYAIAAELVSRSPAVGLRVPHVALVDRPVLSADDLGRLADALGEDQATMMWLGAVGGLRWAECAGLTVGNLDLLTGWVAVRQQLARNRQLEAPKTEASRRRLAIPVWLVDDLAAHLARRGLTEVDAAALVSVNQRGRPLEYAGWRARTWQPACASAGLPGLRFHDLRSMAATALMAAGVDVKTAQARLGHSTPATTLAIYARATAEADRHAADAVGAALGGNRARSAHDMRNRLQTKREKPLLPATSPVGKGGFEPPASASRTLWSELIHRLVRGLRCWSETIFE